MEWKILIRVRGRMFTFQGSIRLDLLHFLSADEKENHYRPRYEYDELILET